MRRLTLAIIFTFSLILFSCMWTHASVISSQVQQQNDNNGAATTQDRIQRFLVKEVRHQLLLLPYYNLFDWLAGEVTADGKVVLRGQVVRPTTKSDAENRVRQVEGVEQVINEIEVLPVSIHDDQLRLAIYRALFNTDSPLFRYATQSVPPIHIIVKNGRVTLKGVVATAADSELAFIKARGVSNAFEVNNELKVESDTIH